MKINNKMSLQAIKAIVKEAVKIKAEGRKEVIEKVDEITENVIKRLEEYICVEIKNHTHRYNTWPYTTRLGDTVDTRDNTIIVEMLDTAIRNMDMHNNTEQRVVRVVAELQEDGSTIHRNV